MGNDHGFTVFIVCLTLFVVGSFTLLHIAHTRRHEIMADKAWKQAERRGARFFCAERNPLSGSASKHTRSDSLHPQLYVEQKYRQSTAIWTLYEDTRTKARVEEKIPVIINHTARKPGMLITIHSDDMPRVVAEYLLSRGFHINPEDLEVEDEIE